MSPASLEQAIEAVLKEGKLKPRVIVAVDLFGQPADYVAIRAIAGKYNLYILEDSAQGFGGRIGSKMACSFGDISTTSFFPAKPLGCYGDGGVIFTDNDEWADLICSLRIHDKGSDKYDEELGFLKQRKSGTFAKEKYFYDSYEEWEKEYKMQN